MLLLTPWFTPEVIIMMLLGPGVIVEDMAKRKIANTISITLETSVEREKDVPYIDVHGKFEKLKVTLLVMRAFQIFQVRQEVVHTFVIQLMFPGLRKHPNQ